MARLFADGVVLAHLAFVAFVVLGGFGVLHRGWFAWLHLPAAAWGALVTLGGLPCPLTSLERTLRRAAGDGGYAGGFIEHYGLAVLYPAGLTRDLQMLLGVLVIVVNLAVYAVVLRRRQRRSGSP